MIPLSERLHIKRLKSKKITIIEKYLEPETSKILTRHINEHINDPISGCIKYEKEYYLGDKKIFVEKSFSPKTKYTYFNNKTKTKIECPNCGYIGKSKEFIDGCPYCNTDFFVEIERTRTEEKGKFWRYTPTGLLFVAILLVMQTLGLIPLEVSFWIVLGLLIFFVITGLIFLISNISSDIKEKDVWHEFKTLGMNINESRVYNNLHSQLCNHYYNDKEYKDLIDFDIYKYLDAKYDRVDDEHYIILTYNIRKYYLENNIIRKSDIISEVRLLMNTNLKHKTGKVYTTSCKNCGSSISIEDTKCKYCDSENPSVLNWILDEIVIDKK